MKVMLYVMANTRYCDFHELSVPADNAVLADCREIINSQKVMEAQQFSDMTMFATQKNGITYIGGVFQLRKIEGMPEVYHYVERDNYSTPCYAFILLAYPAAGSFVVFNGEIIKAVISKLFDSLWDSKEVSQPIIDCWIDVLPCETKLRCGRFRRMDVKDERSLTEAFNYAVSKAIKTHKDFNIFMELNSPISFFNYYKSTRPIKLKYGYKKLTGIHHSFGYKPEQSKNNCKSAGVSYGCTRCGQ